MKVEKVIISYDEKRSQNYQTAGAGMTIEVALDEGETVKQAIERYKPALIQYVTKTTQDEVARLIEETTNDRR
jgi:hypothetical protein